MTKTRDAALVQEGTGIPGGCVSFGAALEERCDGSEVRVELGSPLRL